MPVNERIKAVMERRGYSQNRLAKAAQISQSGLSSILSGASSPKENTLRAISDALGVSVAELTEDERPQDQDETWEIRERMRRDPEYRQLMETLKKADKDHIQTVNAIVNALKKTNR